MKNTVFRIVVLALVAGFAGSCASVDQYGSRAYDGNLNTQSAFNQEVLKNIIRASKYQALSWNPHWPAYRRAIEILGHGLADNKYRSRSDSSTASLFDHK